MNYFSRTVDVYLNHYNKLFWILFAIAGAMFIASMYLGFISIMYLDLVLGIVLVVAGIHRIGEEFFNRSIRNAHDDSVRAINELLQWAEKSYDYTREFKDRHEKRFHNIDRKRSDLEKKTEEQFRDAVRKIIQMENKLNKGMKTLEEDRRVIRKAEKMSREVLKERHFIERRLLDLNSNQFKAMQFMRDNGKITNKDYRTRFRVPEKRAYKDIVSMVQKGLAKRRGKGRNTHYVLSF
jgi:hypothetical protein